MEICIGSASLWGWQPKSLVHVWTRCLPKTRIHSTWNELPHYCMWNMQSEKGFLFRTLHWCHDSIRFNGCPVVPQQFVSGNNNSAWEHVKKGDISSAPKTQHCMLQKTCGKLFNSHHLCALLYYFICGTPAVHTRNLGSYRSRSHVRTMKYGAYLPKVHNMVTKLFSHSFPQDIIKLNTFGNNCWFKKSTWTNWCGLMHHFSLRASHECSHHHHLHFLGWRKVLWELSLAGIHKVRIQLWRKYKARQSNL